MMILNYVEKWAEIEYYKEIAGFIFCWVLLGIFVIAVLVFATILTIDIIKEKRKEKLKIKEWEEKK